MEAYRQDFPFLQGDLSKSIYLDNAATSQKPKQVLETLQRFYKSSTSNVHRATHKLARRATNAYEEARDKVAAFIGARHSSEVVFTRNATEAINLVAQSWARHELKPGDEILLTEMEHHSNLVPWQRVALETGCRLRFVRMAPDASGLDMEHFKTLLSQRTRLVAFGHVSNVLGTVAPVKELVSLSHAVDALVLLDACQSVPNMPVDVTELDVDFLAASGHKMCGPSGVGFLWGRLQILEKMQPFLSGGDMIDTVHLDSSTYAAPPQRFEAGTPAIAEAVALGAACDYLSSVGMERVWQFDQVLAKRLWDGLSSIPGVQLLGHSAERAAVASFTVQGCHHHDLATLADADDVAMRAGHHCCQPLHHALGLEGSARLSAYFYNTEAEVDTAVEVVQRAIERLRQ